MFLRAAKEKYKLGLGLDPSGGRQSEGEVNFGKGDGEEFDQVEVALIAIVKHHVPNEIVVSGHVVVSDHTAVPPTTEVHADVAPDEGMGGGRGGVTVDPSRPMGQRGGVRWWGRGGRTPPPVGNGVGRAFNRSPPHVQ